jgi:hypothetical protein
MLNTRNIKLVNYKLWDAMHIISWKNICNADVSFNYALASEINKTGNIRIDVTTRSVRVTTTV